MSKKFDKPNAAKKPQEKRKFTSDKGLTPGGKRRKGETSNPFEVIRSRSKHDVMGRDQRGAVKHTVKARSKAIAERQGSLLAEYRSNNKAGSYTDGRFGEAEGMEEEDKVLKRFKEQRSRGLQGKGKGFSLEGAEEQQDDLTHGGLSLSENPALLGDRQEAGDEDGEDYGNLDAQTVNDEHFGGGALGARRRGAAGEQDGGNKEKTKKEIMAEIILKSKLHKADRQQEGKDQLSLLDRLDTDLKSVSSNLDFRGRPAKGLLVGDDPQALLATIRSKIAAEVAAGVDPEEADDEYMVEMRKLATEARAAAADRTRTPEEAAKEERQRLAKLEGARLRRMRGEAEQEGDAEALAKAHKQQTKEGYMEGVAPGDAKADATIPFLIDVPQDHAGLVVLLANRDARQCGVIFRRLLACTHLSLGAENRSKLERLYGLLHEHLDHLCQPASLSGLKPEEWRASVDALVPALWKLTQELPKFAPGFHRIKLAELRSSVTAGLAEGNGMLDGAALMYMRLLTFLFPVSDFRHNVLTPALLLVCECMARVPLTSRADMAAALFLADLTLASVTDSKRVVPELLSLLQGLLQHGFGLDTATSSDAGRVNLRVGALWRDAHTTIATSSTTTTTTSKAAKITKASKTTTTTTTTPTTTSPLPMQHQLSLRAVLVPEECESEVFPQQSLAALLTCVRKSQQLYQRAGVISLPELFEGVASALAEAAAADTPYAAQVEEVHEALAESVAGGVKSRRALVQRLPAAQVRSFNPLFEENYRPGKDYDPSAERAEVKKLGRKLKSEKRGALKELRRDAKFIAGTKQRDQERTDQRRSDSHKKVMTDLYDQQRDSNVWARESKKAKDKKKDK
jgi:nucleolar protein 14